MQFSTMFIILLIGTVFALVWSVISLLDEIRVRDEALDWLYDNGHMSDAAAKHVSNMLQSGLDD